MLAIVPLLCFVLIFLNICKRSDRPDWRGSLLGASVIWGMLLTAITEALSALQALTFEWLLGAWGAVGIGLAAIYIRPNKGKLSLPVIPAVPLSQSLPVVGVSLIVAAVGLIALIAPPNNTDSMIYHMSRVVHWIQNRSVAYYPTHITRQLHHTPWAEMAIMNLQLLSSGDRFANLPQWFSMSGSLVAVSLLTRRLGGGADGQALAAVIAATLPMGILQGSSSQNDYVVSFWLACLIYYALVAAVNDRNDPMIVFGVGAALGLAILTKSTAYIFAFPFLVWFFFSSPRRVRWKSTLVVACVALCLNLGHYWRNLDLYGAPLGPWHGGSISVSGYVNDAFTPSVLTSNVIRNIALHIGTPFSTLNSVTEGAIHELHRLLGIAVDDRRTTWHGTTFHVPIMSNHEDRAGNPLHLALIILSLGLAATLAKRRENRDLVIYSSALVIAFLLLSAGLKWQPWHSRLHLPLFVLWSPAIGSVVSRSVSRTWVTSLAAVLLLSAIPWVFFNKSRPLLRSRTLLAMHHIARAARIDQYFANLPRLRDPYLRAAGFLHSRGCSEIGLVLHEGDVEYLLLMAIHHSGNDAVRLEHVDVQNVSAVKSTIAPFSEFKPCAVISTRPAPDKEMKIGGVVYRQEGSWGPVDVFVKR